MTGSSPLQEYDTSFSLDSEVDRNAEYCESPIEEESTFLLPLGTKIKQKFRKMDSPTKRASFNEKVFDVVTPNIKNFSFISSQDSELHLKTGDVVVMDSIREEITAPLFTTHYQEHSDDFVIPILQSDTHYSPPNPSNTSFTGRQSLSQRFRKSFLSFKFKKFRQTNQSLFKFWSTV